MNRLKNFLITTEFYNFSDKIRATRCRRNVNIIRIEDPGDSRIAEYRNIPDPDLLVRHGLFVAEGRIVVERLLTRSRFETRSVLVTQVALAALKDALETRKDLPVYLVPKPLIHTITSFNIHQGCLAIGVRSVRENWMEIAAHAQRLIVLEHVSNADNVGSICRNAAAFHLDGILLGPACTDPLYRKAIRTSMGASLTLPFAEIRPWPEGIKGLRDAGFKTIALTPHPSVPPIRDIATTTAGQRAALVLGHESGGLSDAALQACDYRARIPIAPEVDSINVATAAALALYELQR
jgi:tRNA G18 (ribose-2'-O)-methylase SpoU